MTLMPQKDFYQKTGRTALGSRLRQLTGAITDEAAQTYRLYGLDINPKWFPVLFVLAGGKRSITSIAREIGHTHPSVSKIARELATRGLIEEHKDGQDARRNLLTLSSEGKRIAVALEEPCADMAAALDGIYRQTRHDLWQAIEEWEDLLAEKSLLQRVKEAKRVRESRELRVVPYEPRYHALFRSLNEEWITEHWPLEETDRRVLLHPQEHILDEGGFILVALRREKPVGVCALLKGDPSSRTWELSKLAVDRSSRGCGAGKLLCEKIIALARELGGSKVYLESNTLLAPAIRLYRQLGFCEVKEHHPIYNRANIHMELDLTKPDGRPA